MLVKARTEDIVGKFCRLENRTKVYLVVASNRELVDGTEITAFMDRVGELTADAHLLDTLLGW